MGRNFEEKRCKVLKRPRNKRGEEEFNVEEKFLTAEQKRIAATAVLCEMTRLSSLEGAGFSRVSLEGSPFQSFGGHGRNGSKSSRLTIDRLYDGYPEYYPDGSPVDDDNVQALAMVRMF